MFGKTALTTASKQLTRSTGLKLRPQPHWGPLDFSGCNWHGNGSIPFQVKNRARFHILYWSVVVLGLGIPVFNAERYNGPARAAKRAEEAASA